MVFEPPNAEGTQKSVWDTAISECKDSTVYDEYLASEEFPVVDHAIAVIDKRKENDA